MGGESVQVVEAVGKVGLKNKIVLFVTAIQMTR